MRRILTLLIVSGLAATACSSGDDATDTTDPPADTQSSTDDDDTEPADENDEGAPLATSDDTSDDEAADELGDDAGDDSTAELVSREPGPDLPGLLDPSDEAIPNDDAVRTGTLDNGLSYYVRFNDNPGAKADLRLAIKAGSVNETGPSTGVAHFAEHMLFNGTELFPQNELIDVLRSFGAAFGADVNAYTSFDETVYLLTVPNADESVALGLSVLEQWLSHATFAADQVVGERGVVLDEWRVRTQSTSGRLFQVAEEMFLTGSSYGGRSPIGTDDSISAMGDEELVGFYDDWYRPDNAAIVVVGDIDVDEIVSDIERLFGPATPRTESMPDRPDVAIELDSEPQFGLHVDPDQQTVDVEVTLPIPGFEGTGTASARVEFIDVMIYDALVRRLDQDLAAGLAPFDDITRGGNSFVETLDAPALYAFTDAARVRATLEALLDEYERAYRYGFTVAETDLARETLRSAFDTRFEGRDSTQDRDYADQYVEDFLRGSGYASIEVEHEVAIELLDSISPEALDLRFRARLANTAPHVIISTPDAVADQMPDESEVLALIASLPGREVAERGALRELPDALMERPAAVDPDGSRNLVERGTPLFDPLEITFPNGVTVILNTNTIIEGQVFFRASSPGGSSLVADDDVVDSLYAADVVTTGGVADFNQAELAQILAGRDVNVGAWISPYYDNLSGSAATADAEQLMQLIHLYMTAPRFDPVALSQVQQRVGPIVDDPGSDPNAAGNDALLDARYPGELRYASLLERSEFDTLDLAGIERVWNQRFGNASDWVFVIVGDFEVGPILDLARSYLATLPSTGTDETPIDVEDPPPAGVVSATVEAGTGDTASVSLLFTSPVDDITARLRVNADVVTELVSARLTDVIREELGESYSPRASTFVTTDPDPVIETFIRVTGSPDRVEAIADLVVGELADLATNGPSEQEFFNAFAQVQEAYGFVNNGTFMTELVDDAVDPARELDDYLFGDAELVSVTAGTVRSYIDSHMPVGQFIKVTVLPR